MVVVHALIYHMLWFHTIFVWYCNKESYSKFHNCRILLLHKDFPHNPIYENQDNFVHQFMRCAYMCVCVCVHIFIYNIAVTIIVPLPPMNHRHPGIPYQTHLWQAGSNKIPYCTMNIFILFSCKNIMCQEIHMFWKAHRYTYSGILSKRSSLSWPPKREIRCF